MAKAFFKAVPGSRVKPDFTLKPFSAYAAATPIYKNINIDA
ncbi:hypothetical protein [Massilia terrae]|uniref:Uncharacterized protein n=1 Tax=Massilia terrae TaxID=1811224 RepID=A0ABT2CZY9_9BURK|nr:hypothetical protein [Massilia terrae]MCS0658658.1 hypothetical protein [Massilia terrae]